MCSICTNVPNKVLSTQRLPVTRRVQTTPAPANHLSTGSVSRKAQSELCWQEAAALHLCLEVSVNTMCLSSAPSSLLTSVLIMTSPRHCSLLRFSSTTFGSLLLLELSFFYRGLIMDWIACHTCLVWRYFYHNGSQLPEKTSALNCFASLVFSGFLRFQNGNVRLKMCLCYCCYHIAITIIRKFKNIHQYLLQPYHVCIMHMCLCSSICIPLQLSSMWAGGAEGDGRNLVVTVYLLYLSLLFAKNKSHVGDAAWALRVHPFSSSSFFPFTSTHPPLSPYSAISFLHLTTIPLKRCLCFCCFFAWREEFSLRSLSVTTPYL